MMTVIDDYWLFQLHLRFFQRFAHLNSDWTISLWPAKTPLLGSVFRRFESDIDFHAIAIIWGFIIVFLLSVLPRLARLRSGIQLVKGGSNPYCQRHLCWTWSVLLSSLLGARLDNYAILGCLTLMMSLQNTTLGFESLLNIRFIRPSNTLDRSSRWTGKKRITGFVFGQSKQYYERDADWFSAKRALIHQFDHHEPDLNRFGRGSSNIISTIRTSHNHNHANGWRPS
jgi:hypothetical protein